MDQDLVVGGGEAVPMRAGRGGIVVSGGNEVGNHRDVAPLAAERAVRLFAQVLRHRRHAVGALDRELGDGEVGRVLPDQRDIGAVERRNDLEVALVGHHLFREPGRRGEGDGVVHVQQLEPLALGDLVLFDRQRQCVRRLLEQRIVDRGDFVKGHALDDPPQPERAGVGDEVDVVPAAGQLQPQLGRHSAGAAVGRVAGDADAHGSRWSVLGSRLSVIGHRATPPVQDRGREILGPSGSIQRPHLFAGPRTDNR